MGAVTKYVDWHRAQERYIGGERLLDFCGQPDMPSQAQWHARQKADQAFLAWTKSVVRTQGGAQGAQKWAVYLDKLASGLVTDHAARAAGLTVAAINGRRRKDGAFNAQVTPIIQANWRAHVKARGRPAALIAKTEARAAKGRETRATAKAAQAAKLATKVSQKQARDHEELAAKEAARTKAPALRESIWGDVLRRFLGGETKASICTGEWGVWPTDKQWNARMSSKPAFREAIHRERDRRRTLVLERPAKAVRTPRSAACCVARAPRISQSLPRQSRPPSLRSVRDGQALRDWYILQAEQKAAAKAAKVKKREDKAAAVAQAKAKAKALKVQQRADKAAVIEQAKAEAKALQSKQRADKTAVAALQKAAAKTHKAQKRADKAAALALQKAPGTPAKGRCLIDRSFEKRTRVTTQKTNDERWAERTITLGNGCVAWRGADNRLITLRSGSGRTYTVKADKHALVRVGRSVPHGHVLSTTCGEDGCLNPDHITSSPRQVRPVKTIPQSHIDAAVAVVRSAYVVSSAQLLSRSKGCAAHGEARAVLRYLLHIVSQHALMHVGAALGMDKSTIAHSMALVEDKRDDGAFDTKMDSLEALYEAACRNPLDYPVALRCVAVRAAKASKGGIEPAMSSRMLASRSGIKARICADDLTAPK